MEKQPFEDVFPDQKTWKKVLIFQFLRLYLFWNPAYGALETLRFAEFPSCFAVPSAGTDIVG